LDGLNTGKLGGGLGGARSRLPFSGFIYLLASEVTLYFFLSFSKKVLAALPEAAVSVGKKNPN
jgi:hypothetical protein